MAVQTVRDILIASGDVTALVGQKISPVQMAQGTTLPAVVLTRISMTPANHLDGAATLDTNRVQLDVFANTYAECRSIADACRAALEVAGTVLLDESDIDFESEVKEYRVIQDWQVWT